ncbi:32026_t:CDS:2, partial [Gigaspora margarita]
LNQKEKKTDKEAKKETKDETKKEIDSTNRSNITKIINLIKKMKEWPKEIKERAIALLKSEYTYIKDEKSLN